MFKNAPMDPVSGGAPTVIGASVKVDGDFTGQGDIIVEGIVHGKLKTDHNVRIGEQARVQAHITAANATIAGEVRGNIKVKDTLDLASSAKIFGDIETKVVSIAAGAIVNGKLTMTKDLPPDFQPPTAEEAQKQKKLAKEKSIV